MKGLQIKMLTTICFKFIEYYEQTYKSYWLKFEYMQYKLKIILIL